MLGSRSFHLDLSSRRQSKAKIIPGNHPYQYTNRCFTSALHGVRPLVITFKFKRLSSRRARVFPGAANLTVGAFK